MDKDRLFPIIEAPKAELPFKIKTKSIQLSLGILYERMICSTVDYHDLHILN